MKTTKHLKVKEKDVISITDNKLSTGRKEISKSHVKITSWTVEFTNFWRRFKIVNKFELRENFQLKKNLTIKKMMLSFTHVMAWYLFISIYRKIVKITLNWWIKAAVKKMEVLGKL